LHNFSYSLWLTGVSCPVYVLIITQFFIMVVFTLVALFFCFCNRHS
jgi:hypothetical protein